MKMQVLALCLTLIAAVSAQPNCSDLGFGDLQPIPGNNLPICAQDGLQCCSEDYLERVRERVRNGLQDFLQSEFEAVLDTYADGVDNLLDYFDEDFTEDLVEGLPFADFVNRSSEQIANVLANLVNNFEIDDDDDDFNVGGFVENLLGSSIDSIGSTVPPSTLQCIERVFNSLIRRDAIDGLTSRLQQIRMAITALTRVQRFLDQQEDRLEDATIPDSCVDLFIENAFCSRCNQSTPPLCLATCNALVRGCYSPYYTVFNRQYQRLWDAVRNIVEVANITVQDIMEEEDDLIDIDDLRQAILDECGMVMIDQPSAKRRRRQVSESGDGEEEEDDESSDSSEDSDGMPDAMIPAALVDGILQLDGAFQYEREGLMYCLDALEEFMDKSETFYCTGLDFCTSENICTDGVDVLKNNQTERIFDLNDVGDQALNPVYADREGDLQNIADMIDDEDPVAAFLASDEFTEVVPEVVNDNQENSATGIVASTLTILLVVLVTLL